MTVDLLAPLRLTFLPDETCERLGVTSIETDLQLIDADPKDPFDFSPERYNEQLVAGYSKNTANKGLMVFMPDLNDLPSRPH